MATIASMLAGSILVTAAGHPEAVPLVIGAGNALLAAVNGASGSQVLLAAGVGAAASIVGAGVGGVAGVGLYSATNSTLVAQLGGAVAGAAAASAMTAACYGGDVLRAIATGATGAAAFAVAYAAVEVYNAPGSPVVGPAAADANGGSGGGAFLGDEITGDPRVAAAKGAYEHLTGEDLTGVRIFKGGTALQGAPARAVNSNTVVISDGVFSSPAQDFYSFMGHEFKHVTQFRTIQGFLHVYHHANQVWGYNANPFEVQAARMGAGFASYATESGVPANPAYQYPPYFP